MITNSEIHRIIRMAAHKHPESYNQSPYFEAHDWVLEAIIRAYELGSEDEKVNQTPVEALLPTTFSLDELSK